MMPKNEPYIKPNQTKPHAILSLCVESVSRHIILQMSICDNQRSLKCTTEWLHNCTHCARIISQNVLSKCVQRQADQNDMIKRVEKNAHTHTHEKNAQKKIQTSTRTRTRCALQLMVLSVWISWNWISKRRNYVFVYRCISCAVNVAAQVLCTMCTPCFP